MKYNDNGTYKDIYVKAFDTLPVGTEVDYDGSTVPSGWTAITGYEEITLNGSNSITITYQKCRKIGNLIYLNVSFTTNSALAAYTTLFDNAPKNETTPLQIALFNANTGTFDDKAVVLNGVNIQNRTSLESGITYRFSITYIAD